MGYAAIALAAGLAAMLFWQMRRAAKAIDQRIEAIEDMGILSRRVDAQAVAIGNRDKIIEALTDERDRYRKAVELATNQLQEQVTKNVDTPEEVANSVRNALASIGLLQNLPTTSKAEGGDSDTEVSNTED